VQTSHAPNLRFEELNELGRKIAIIAEQYATSRDQAVVGQIAGGVMHDINTPLQPLLSAMDLAEENSTNETKRLKYLENLFRMAKLKLPMISGIVQTTLDGVRQIKVNPVRADISETIRDAISASGEAADLRSTEIEFINDASESLIDHDPTQMTRVLANLIKNGVEAQTKSEQKRIRIQLVKGPDATTVTVEDAGPGLATPPDKIFHAFKSTKTHGSGLGLHISWKIVRAHGGDFEVGPSSNLGGARFAISLPTTRVSA